MLGVQKNGMFYSVAKMENDELKFIFRNLSATDKNDFENKQKLGKCYMNHKKLGVMYNKEIMDIIGSASDHS
jgi:hypothetical protein